MPGAQTGPVPILRMFGVTMDGHSVMAHIHGFHPHFHVKAPNDFDPTHCSEFRVCLLILYYYYYNYYYNIECIDISIR